MSAIPAFVMGTLCIVGGVTGYVRSRSIPSLVAGVSVGALYLYSGDSIPQEHGQRTRDCARCFRTPSPIFSPEVLQGPNPCSVDGHVGRYWCILRQDSIQLASGLDGGFVLARHFSL
ncbi:hypothetical protein EDB85DRAFT_1469427 [Lactarius pseudohatsudake]|nr:hypothetical protein EDB85DRAFT_1469427 [Lactarius pseudohatsudake]